MYFDLYSEIGNLKRLYADLAENYDKLKKSHDKLQQSHDDLKKDYDDLKRQVVNRNTVKECTHKAMEATEAIK